MRIEVETALNELAAANGGRLTCDLVIEAARNVDSPLHNCFEWDAPRAAYLYWCEQARHLIRAVTVEIETDTIDIKCVMYVRDPEASKHEQGYISVPSLFNKKRLAAKVVRNECDRAISAMERALSVSDALDIQNAVKQLLIGIRAVRSGLPK